MTEERVYVICLRQNVASPSVQHGDLQEGCEVFDLVFQEQMPGRFIKQSLVMVSLAQLAIQVPVLTARPYTPFGDPEQ